MTSVLRVLFLLIVFRRYLYKLILAHDVGVTGSVLAFLIDLLVDLYAH